MLAVIVKIKLKCHQYRIYFVYLLAYSLLFCFISYKSEFKKSDESFKNSNYLLKQKIFRNNVEKCLHTLSKARIPMSNNDTSAEKWQKLTSGIYIYSAFLDTCVTVGVSMNHCIKLVGAMHSDNSTDNLKCAFKYKNGIVVINDNPTISVVPEAHGMPYAATLFYCTLPQNEEHSEINYVSLFNNTNNEIVWMPIQHRNFDTTSRNASVSICVRPLFASPSPVLFGEFLAYYSIMQIDQFYIYYTTSATTLESIDYIAQYANISLQLLSWNIPLNNSLIHEYGQIVFTQDCIARNKHVHSHTIIVDFDEFLVVKGYSDLKKFSMDMDLLYPTAGSYIIRNSYLCSEYAMKNYSPFRILMYTRRQFTVWAYWYRSKYLLKPERVQQGGIHQIWKHELDFEEAWLPSGTALLYHYKPCIGSTQTYFFNLVVFNITNDWTVLAKEIISMKEKILDHLIIKLFLSLNQSNESQLCS